MGGVFLLDSKRFSGSVTVAEGVLTVRRHDDPNLLYTHPGAGRLLGLTQEAHDRVRAATRLNTWIAPVMVIWADFRRARSNTGAHTSPGVTSPIGYARDRTCSPKVGCLRSPTLCGRRGSRPLRSIREGPSMALSSTRSGQTPPADRKAFGIACTAARFRCLRLSPTSAFFRREAAALQG